MRRFTEALLAIVVFGAVVFFALGGVRGITIAFEKTHLLFSPSAERAYAYGSKHFQAKKASAYDIHSAGYFFDRAAEIDPGYPYIQHQLARVAFLRGDFATALQHIDREIDHYGTEHVNAYYMRGLIKGFSGDYAGAIVDYEIYLHVDPTNWAAVNDYAWVLLRAGRAQEALESTTRGLSYFPDNPWLLNSNAIALYELGHVAPALDQARKAESQVQKVTEEEWLNAYPGNDPLVAADGITALKKSIQDNIHTITAAMEKSEVQ